jgi:hypothetical protein
MISRPRVDHLGKGSVDVVGHSDEGIVALLLAMWHFTKIGRIVVFVDKTCGRIVKTNQLKLR